MGNPSQPFPIALPLVANKLFHISCRFQIGMVLVAPCLLSFFQGSQEPFPLKLFPCRLGNEPHGQSP